MNPEYVAAPEEYILMDVDDYGRLRIRLVDKDHPLGETNPVPDLEVGNYRDIMKRCYPAMYPHPKQL